MGVALLFVGLFGLAAPYTGTPLGLVVLVPPVVEIVDHVVPGIVIVGVAGLILAIRRIPLAAALIATLAAFWMTATHLPLLAQAAQGRVGWPTASWHTAPGLILLVLCAIAVSLAWRTTPAGAAGEDEKGGGVGG